MNNTPLNEDLLWDYADDLLDAQTRQAVEAQLSQSPEWQREMVAIQAAKAQLKAMTLDKPRRDFTDRVMAAWATEQTLAYKPDRGKDWIVYMISALFGVFIFIPFIMLIGRLATFQSSTPMPVKMPDFNFGQFLEGLNFSGAIFAGFVVLCVFSLLILERFLRYRKFLAGLAT